MAWQWMNARRRRAHASTLLTRLAPHAEAACTVMYVCRDLRECKCRSTCSPRLPRNAQEGGDAPERVLLESENENKIEADFDAAAKRKSLAGRRDRRHHLRRPQAGAGRSNDALSGRPDHGERP